jgi:hypothetical protein
MFNITINKAIYQGKKSLVNIASGEVGRGRDDDGLATPACTRGTKGLVPPYSPDFIIVRLSSATSGMNNRLFIGVLYLKMLVSIVTSILRRGHPLLKRKPKWCGATLCRTQYLTKEAK